MPTAQLETIDHPTAARNLAAAVATRDGLIAAAGRGETVTAQSMRAAEQECRDCETDLSLGAAVTRAQEADAQRQRIADLEAAGAALDQRLTELVAANIKAGSELDAAVGRAQAAAEVKNTASRLLAGHTASMHHHNLQVAEEVQSNPILAALHPSLWPKSHLLGRPISAPEPVGVLLAHGTDRWRPETHIWRLEPTLKSAEQIAKAEGAHLLAPGTPLPTISAGA